MQCHRKYHHFLQLPNIPAHADLVLCRPSLLPPLIMTAEMTQQLRPPQMRTLLLSRNSRVAFVAWCLCLHMADSRPLISPILQMLFFARPSSLRMNIQQPSLRVAADRKNQGLACAPEKQTSVSGRENGNDGVHAPDIIAEVPSHLHPSIQGLSNISNILTTIRPRPNVRHQHFRKKQKMRVTERETKNLVLKFLPSFT